MHAWSRQGERPQYLPECMHWGAEGARPQYLPECMHWGAEGERVSTYHVAA